MANKDLRDWIDTLEKADQLQKINGANHEEEIGGIVDVYQRQTGNKAVLFSPRCGASISRSACRRTPRKSASSITGAAT